MKKTKLTPDQWFDRINNNFKRLLFLVPNQITFPIVTKNATIHDLHCSEKYPEQFDNEDQIRLIAAELSRQIGQEALNAGFIKVEKTAPRPIADSPYEEFEVSLSMKMIRPSDLD